MKPGLFHTLLPIFADWEAHGKQALCARSSAVEQPTFNRQAVGSIPTAHTIRWQTKKPRTFRCAALSLWVDSSAA